MKQLQITRIFDAPRHLVFTWWSHAEKLQQWSGCKETTRCEIQMDFRVGGSFTQKMQIAGKGEFTFTGQYDEIIEPERIVYHADFGFAVTRVTVEFFEQGGQYKGGSDTGRIPGRESIEDGIARHHGIVRQTGFNFGRRGSWNQ